MKIPILLFLCGTIIAHGVEPAQSWAFDSGIEDYGEILGKIETAEAGIALSPADDGGGGILLATDPTEAMLPAGAMSVEAWVRIDKTLEWGGIIGAVRDTNATEQGWVLGYRRDRFLFGLATQEVKRITYMTSSSTFVLKEWYHVVATYDGVNQQLLYVDGILSAKSEVQRGAILQPDPLFYMIGAYRDENDYYPLTGCLAGISVWHETLLPEEIALRFEARKAEFPGIEPGPPERPGGDGDWLTWMGDNRRSGRVNTDIKLHPTGKPEWIYEPLHSPAPAWPEVAKSDHWRKRSTPESPKSTFDWVHDVVSADERIFFASSADDSVRCLDAKNGKQLWKFTAGGPVRLVPTLSEDRVIFGCDDGAVYCLNATDGNLLWKSRPASMPDRRLPGNGRLMSVWPVRTGILVKENTGYFGAGLFPSEGAWYCTVDLRDGKILDEKKVDFSPQGYIREDAGRLLAQSGRVTSGGTLGAVTTKGKPRSAMASRLSKRAQQKFPHTAVETPRLVFAGGDTSVAAFEPGGDEPVWLADVDSPARGLAIADGKLFVSTMSGRIYAFGVGNGESRLRETAIDGGIEVAPAVLSKLPRTRGYALVIGLGDGNGIRALAENSDLNVIGIDTDLELVAKTRRDFSQSVLYGKRVSIQEVATFDSLPFVEGIFNLIIDKTSAASTTDVKRILRPWDGLALLGSDREIRGEIPKKAGSWTHAYADAGNSVSSRDSGVDGEMRLRWFGRPGPEHIVDRHLRSPPPLAGGGFLLVPGRDYLFGLDSHNGTVLWEREIPQFMRASMLRDCGNLVLEPRSKRVLAVSGASCLVLDAETGATLRTLSVDAEKEEWGYVAFDQGVLIGSAVDKGAVRRELSYAAIWEGGYGDGKRAVCSRSLFALNPATGQRLWTYQTRGAVPNPSICMTSGQLVFLESRNPETLALLTERPAGRWGYDEIIEAAGADLVALDLKTGKERWRKPFDAKGGSFLTFYLSCQNNKLVAVNSRNFALPPVAIDPPPPTTTPPPEGEPPVEVKPLPKKLHYDITVLAASTGKLIWERTLNTGRRPNLIHGEQDLHPVIAGERLIVEPVVFDLTSGEELFTFKRQGGGGCGTISASSNKLYFRAGHPAELDLESREQELLSKATRPGCWINMIPANGLLLVPEGSSGCICGFPVQASMAFGPE